MNGCDRHNMKKDYLLCLDNECDDRLICEQCYSLDHKHNGHRFIMIEQLMNNDES